MSPRSHLTRLGDVPLGRRFRFFNAYPPIDVTGLVVRHSLVDGALFSVMVEFAPHNAETAWHPEIRVEVLP